MKTLVINGQMICTRPDDEARTLAASIIEPVSKYHAAVIRSGDFAAWSVADLTVELVDAATGAGPDAHAMMGKADDPSAPVLRLFADDHWIMTAPADVARRAAARHAETFAKIYVPGTPERTRWATDAVRLERGEIAEASCGQHYVSLQPDDSIHESARLARALLAVTEALAAYDAGEISGSVLVDRVREQVGPAARELRQ